MKELQLDQFEKRHTISGHWYAYRGHLIKPSYFRNWPFHKTQIERANFLKNVGVTDNDGGFPYMKTEEEALFLLILAITEYNETVTKSV